MDRKVISGILFFVSQRRKEEGGYGATPLLPATVEDTYHALRILEILGPVHSLGKIAAPGPDQSNLKSYIAEAVKTQWVSARTTFQALYCASSIGIDLDIAKVTEYISRKLQRRAHLAERYYCARILKEILGVRNLAAWPRAGMSAFYKWRTGRDLWMKIYLHRIAPSAQSSPRQKIVEWLQKCQNSDGGFGFFPNTTSYIENCHTCIRALALLCSKPLDSEACLHFVLACGTGRGGFARNPGAAPFLDATWHAVAVLALLEVL